MAYVYRHIRLDKNQPFYIGIGSDANYKRAREKFNRSKFWKSIVSKTKYEIQIIMDGLTWDKACDKEKEFISLYGRKDLDKGTLVNLTDGGEGALGILMSEENKHKLSKRMVGKKNSLGYKHSDDTKIKISLHSKNRIVKQETKNKLSNLLKGNKNNLGKKLSEETKNKISKANKGRALSQNTKDAVSKAHWKGYVYQLDMNTDNVIWKYKTAKEANLITGINCGSIKSVIIGKRKSAGGYKWIRDESKR